jgi:hypothetical protein
MPKFNLNNTPRLRRAIWCAEDLLLLSAFVLLSFRFLVPVGDWGLSGWSRWAKLMLMMWILVESDRLRVVHGSKS